MERRILCAHAYSHNLALEPALELTTTGGVLRHKPTLPAKILINGD